MLSVWWNRVVVGEVFSDDGGAALRFRYATDAKRAISLSLPLGPDVVDGSFFSNLLPEAGERDRLAQSLGVSAENSLQLLKAIGGDCAGALVVLPKGELPRAAPAVMRPLDERLLIAMRVDGALATVVHEGLRLSLAGAQEKVPVVLRDGQLFLPSGEAPPSTHILKFPSRAFPGIVENELFMLRLAGAVGLPVASAQLWSLPGGDKALLVERFDRHDGVRLHQEDLCQATGRSEHLKYEGEGGPALDELVALLRDRCRDPQLAIAQLLRWQAFNVLCGNNDGHAKNIAMLLEPVVHLAPAYDLVCTRAWPALAKNLALRVGDARLAGDVGPRAWALLAERCTLGKSFVVDLAHDVRARVEAALPAVFEATAREANPTPLRAVRRQIEEHCAVAANRARTETDWATPKKPKKKKPAP